MARMSCNGCRVLRKGCSSNCSIRPCLQWMKNPEFQANATLFLAKFYGRAGLINLIEAGPLNQRPAIFRSLLYEACGRIVNPTYGSVGLLSSGNWQACQAAVEAVLNGQPVIQSPPSSSSSSPITTGHQQPLNSYIDIRHSHKPSDDSTRFKRPRLSSDMEEELSKLQYCRRRQANDHQANSSPVVVIDDDEVRLDLTLGLEAKSHSSCSVYSSTGDHAGELGG